MKVTHLPFFCIVALIATGISTRAQERSVQDSNQQAEAAVPDEVNRWVRSRLDQTNKDFPTVVELHPDGRFKPRSR